MKRISVAAGVFLFIVILLLMCAGCAQRSGVLRLQGGKVRVDAGSNTAAFTEVPAADDARLAAFGLTHQQVSEQFFDGVILVIYFENTDAFIRIYRSENNEVTSFSALQDSEILQLAEAAAQTQYVYETSVFTDNRQVHFARVTYTFFSEIFRIDNYVYTNNEYILFSFLKDSGDISDSEIAAFDKIVAGARFSGFGYRNHGEQAVLINLLAEMACAAVVMILPAAILSAARKKAVSKKTAWTVFGLLGLLILLGGYFARSTMNLGYYGIVSVLLIPLAVWIANYGWVETGEVPAAEPKPEKPLSEAEIQDAEKIAMQSLDWIESENEPKPKKKKKPAETGSGETSKKKKTPPKTAQTGEIRPKKAPKTVKPDSEPKSVHGATETVDKPKKKTFKAKKPEGGQ